MKINIMYVLRDSSYNHNLLNLFSTIKSNDCLLLISDGVIIGLSNSLMLNLICSISFKIYALINDINARGIKKFISSKIIIINYIEFVRLTEKYTKQIIL